VIPPAFLLRVLNYHTSAASIFRDVEVRKRLTSLLQGRRQGLLWPCRAGHPRQRRRSRFRGLAILALTSLGVGGRAVRRARTRLADMMLPDGTWPLSVPFYSAVKFPRERLPGGVLARLMLGERQGQHLWLGGEVYAVSLYVDGYRTISSALASLSLMSPGPSAERDALPVRRGKSCHPRYRCADHVRYVADHALPPYLVSR
jgi:hypothetical protein